MQLLQLLPNRDVSTWLMSSTLRCANLHFQQQRPNFSAHHTKFTSNSAPSKVQMSGNPSLSTAELNLVKSPPIHCDPTLTDLQGQVSGALVISRSAAGQGRFFVISGQQKNVVKVEIWSSRSDAALYPRGQHVAMTSAVLENQGPERIRRASSLIRALACPERVLVLLRRDHQ